MEKGARYFLNSNISPGIWEELSNEVKDLVIYNAPTFLDEMHDPESWTVDLTKLREFDKPLLLTYGELSEPHFAAILEELHHKVPKAQKAIIPDAGHSPQVSQPETYSELLKSFIQRDK